MRKRINLLRGKQERRVRVIQGRTERREEKKNHVAVERNTVILPDGLLTSTLPTKPISA